MKQRNSFTYYLQDEIVNNRSLQIYGACLSLTYLITAYYWASASTVGELTQQLLLPLCWPYYPSCQATHNLVFLNFKFFNFLLGLFGLVGVVSFLYKKVNYGIIFLSLGLILKFFIFSQDFRLMGNYHYMSFLVILFFILIPDKVQTLQILLPLFYVSAGLLKLHPEWLSGANLLKSTWIPQSILYYLMLFVIVLELIMVPILIFIRKWTYAWWFIFGNLIIFHIISWHLVGFFYPCIMFCLLAFYILCDPLPTSWPRPAALVFLALVALPQLARTFFPGIGYDGKARLLSLNMLDTMPKCSSHYVIRTSEKIVFTSLETETIAPRIRCDPILFIAELKRLCALKNSDGSFEIDLFVEIKNAVSDKFTKMIDIRNACSKNVYINLLGEISI